MNLRHLLEAAIAYPAYYGLKLLPFGVASALGGWLGKHIGYRLPVTERARKNLRLVMPELSTKEHEVILRGMWDNLGRVVGEFPHMPSLTGASFTQRVEIAGQEHWDSVIEGGKGFICFGAHLANWEIAPHAASELGHPLRLIYRPANNPYVDRLIRKSRHGRHDGLLPKGKEGARGLLEQLRAGKPVAMLVDQKMNEGIAVPFFGKEAMTAPAMAEFARKFRVPMLPVHVERLPKARFRLTVSPPLHADDRDAATIMAEVNTLIEQWIKKNPEQWFWLHRRWGK